MTVKALPGVGIYHIRVRPDGTTDEHASPAPIRRTPSSYVLYCAPCDAVTVIARDSKTEERRMVEATIARSHLVKDEDDILDPVTRQPSFEHCDPLVLARADGDTRIPSRLPSGHDERRALVHSLRSPSLEEGPIDG